tara:strand:+ start:3495 stop:3803 length:309 start_codon:yes stop_codon:yes gene_type:complete
MIIRVYYHYEEAVQNASWSGSFTIATSGSEDKTEYGVHPEHFLNVGITPVSGSMPLDEEGLVKVRGIAIEHINFKHYFWNNDSIPLGFEPNVLIASQSILEH